MAGRLREAGPERTTGFFQSEGRFTHAPEPRPAAGCGCQAGGVQTPTPARPGELYSHLTHKGTFV